MLRPIETHRDGWRSSLCDENMGTQQKRRGAAPFAERRIDGKSMEITCGCWPEKPLILRLALMIFLGMTILLLPQYLTFSSFLTQRQIESLLLAGEGNSAEEVRKPDETSSVWSKPNETSSVWSKQNETSSVWSKPNEASSVWSKPNETSSARSKPNETSSVWSKQNETSSVWSKPNETSSVWSKQNETSSVWSKQNETSSVWSKPNEASSVWSKPNEASSVWSKPNETSSARSKPNETSSVWSKPNETSSARSKPNETSSVWSKRNETSSARSKPDEASSVWSKPDETLGSLLPLPTVFENNTCISRSQEYSLRQKTSPHKPSPALVAKLREYERRHRKCSPEARNFSPSKNATEQDFGECRFIAWIAAAGLGNRIMTLTSAFVYALLTDRVLLIDRSENPDELFCEPFPGSSWLLPETFPNEWMKAIEPNSSFRFGSLVQNGAPHNGYAYLNIMHDYDAHDKKFFCADCQAYLSGFPWLFLRSDLYFIPGLHFVSEFRADLDKLFPERETVFHHIVRYLLHPSDSVWGMISSFYNATLASAQHQVGLQIRYLVKPNITKSVISDLVLNCTLEKKLLPNLTSTQGHVDDADTSTSVLVASLHEVFSERLRGFYQKNSQHLGVYTASHEEGQLMNSVHHDKKALADMYLLSFSDTLITSSWSTFGYVVQGISGVMPWILTHLEDEEAMEEVLMNRNYCSRGVSLEPCFHKPPALDCDKKGWCDDPGKTLPYIQNCEDVWWGIKIMEPVPSTRR